MENVATRKLLSGCHLLSANDADGIGACKFFGSRIRESLIHVGGRSSVLNDFGYAFLEGAESEVDLAQNVKREAVVLPHRKREDDVYDESKDVEPKLHVHQNDALVLPCSIVTEIPKVQTELSHGVQAQCQKQNELRSEEKHHRRTFVQHFCDGLVRGKDVADD